jgi:hypothetical protein
MKPQTVGLISGIALTVPACVIALVSAGAGHGNYFAFKLVFPITMLSALLGGITLPFVIVGLAQFPAYGFMVGRHWNAPERKNVIWKIVGFHIVLAVLAVVIPNPSFS